MNNEKDKIVLLGPVEDFKPNPYSPSRELGGIKLGDIVSCKEWSLEQGRVFSIDPAREYQFSIQIYRENSWMLGIDFDYSPNAVNLVLAKLSETKLCDLQCWDVEVLWKRKFSQNSLVLRTPSLDKVDISLCQREGCEERSVQWILYNFIGTVYQIFVCKEHTSLHGICSEAFPFVQRRLQTEAEVA